MVLEKSNLANVSFCMIFAGESLCASGVPKHLAASRILFAPAAVLDADASISAVTLEEHSYLRDT